MSKRRKVEYKLGPENLISVAEAQRRGLQAYDWRKHMNKVDDELEHGEYNPDWADTPGKAIRTIVDGRGWALVEFAAEMNMTVFAVVDLINGREPITPEIASRLAQILDTSPEFWLRREAQYRKQLARLARLAEIVET